MNTVEQMPARAVLLIATLDTKAEEALYLKGKLESLGCRVILMDTGILEESGRAADVTRHQVAAAAGTSIAALLASGDKGKGIDAMRQGASVLAKTLYEEGGFQGVLSIGGAQGTDIGTAVMRELPFGVPKFMVSTVASGRATFGPFVGTKDITIMHSVADIQGINFITQRVFDNAAAAVCGMVMNAGAGDWPFFPHPRGPLDARHRHAGGDEGTSFFWPRRDTTPSRSIRTGPAGSPWRI